MVGQLLIQSGWLVTDDSNTTELEQVHALRQQIKGIRYQMALFKNFYGEDYQPQVNSVKEMQDLLGERQDEVVLQSFLVNVIGLKQANKVT